jgi:hypothetical protein
MWFQRPRLGFLSTAVREEQRKSIIHDETIPAIESQSLLLSNKDIVDVVLQQAFPTKDKSSYSAETSTKGRKHEPVPQRRVSPGDDRGYIQGRKI